MKKVIFYTDIHFAKKSCYAMFLHESNEWKNPQFNFSSQNFRTSIFFKWAGQVTLTKIQHLFFSRDFGLFFLLNVLLVYTIPNLHYFWFDFLLLFPSVCFFNNEALHWTNKRSVLLLNFFRESVCVYSIISRIYHPSFERE